MKFSKLGSHAKQLASTAHHEAGHAVAAFHFDLNPSSISISTDFDDDSFGRHSRLTGLQDIDPGVENPTPVQQRQVETNVFVCCTGAWAQKRFFPKGFIREYHAESDEEVAFRFLGQLESDQGILTAYYRLIDLRARKFVQNESHWEAISYLAGCLLEQPKMPGDEVWQAIIYGYEIGLGHLTLSEFEDIDIEVVSSDEVQKVIEHGKQ